MANFPAEDLLSPTVVPGFPTGTQLYKLEATDLGGTSPQELAWVDTQISIRYAPSPFGGPFAPGPIATTGQLGTINSTPGNVEPGVAGSPTPSLPLTLGDTWFA